MTLIQESYLQCLLNECEADFGREEKEAQVAVNKRLTQVQAILKNNVKQTFASFSLETIVRFMELVVEIDEKFAYAEDFVALFFERVTAPSQFYIRALFVKAKLIAYIGHKKQLKGDAMIAVLKQSIQQISKALDLISGPNEPAQKGKDAKGSSSGQSNKSKYGFLIYNASTCLYKIIRFMLKQSWLKNFTEIIERICKLFDELDEPDHNWKCRFMLILFQCLYDSERKADAWKVLDTLWEKAKVKNVDFLDSLFRLRVHYSKQNNALTNTIKKDTEGADPNCWKILEVFQKMRSGAIPEPQVEKQLMGVVNQISLGVLSNNQQSASVALSPIMQERLGEAGRIALKFNVINIATSITNFLAKARQPNQKAMILNEYNKAELSIKKKNEFVDKKTGMVMNTTQMKELEIEKRKQALKILEKVMMANKNLNNAQLIYEGAILIWNISLPFLCPQHREYTAKAFDQSCQLLQQIDSTDHDLRTKMHLQLAKTYFGNEKMFPEVTKNIMKALKLDHSIPTNKIAHKFELEQDQSLYARPLERYLHSFREKIMLKTMQIMERGELDNVMNDLWNVAEEKSETARIDTLQKCLRVLTKPKQEKYVIEESRMLVQEEIKQEKILFEQKRLREYKKRKLLAYEVAELSFEWEMNDFAKKAARFVLEDKFESKNSIELVIAQSRCSYFLAQIQIDQLIQDNFEVPFADVTLYQAQEGVPAEIGEQKKKQIEGRKKVAFEHLAKGLQLAQSIQQHWLVFNGAICIWNNFLHAFRNPVNDTKLHKDLCALLKKFFESMKNSLKEIQSKGIVYYDIDIKIQTFANIGLIYARLMQNQKQNDEVVKVCEALLVTPLSPHTRKLTNSMKARVSGSGGKSAPAGKDQKKGGKDAPTQKAGGYSDSFLFEIFSQLEIIQNSTNKNETENLIKKCFENLQNWQPKDKDQTQLQLHAQLWARLARLAVNQASTTMYKYALRCSEYSLSLLSGEKNISAVPSNRLRWYSLSQFLYSECLLRIANPETQDIDSYEKLLFAALQHAVEATHKGYKSSINALVVDGAKQVWNICHQLQESPKNRAKLIEPLKTVLYYLKETKQQNQIDLVLLLAQLFFKSANQNNENKIGEEVADMLFTIVPDNMQKSLWEAKMVFMSKQGKNQLQAISNMKEADPSLQSKLWVKLARIATNPKKQHAAYNKAIQILKKQNSIEIVEVLIEYSEWQLRVGNQKAKNVSSNLLLASDFLIDIEYGEDDGEQDDGEEDKGTVFSRSTRGKKSHTSKSIKSSMNSSKVKKNSEKKPNNSIKSKNGSGISRMNRSGRVAKTTKSKNSKSIFSERQEDPNPQNLNCIHFERLFRIHTILSIISDSVVNRIRYALDAKQFLTKIIEISLNTLNEIHENSFKFSQKGKKSDEPKLRVPSTLKQWVNFELNKEVIEKIKLLEEPNFMGSYTFERPELTFTYLRSLAQIFNTYGLNYHAIPVFVVQKFIASEILGNKNYYEIADLEMKLTLKKLAYLNTDKPGLNQIQVDKYTLSQTDLKLEMIKTESKVKTQNDDANIFQNVQPPSLVKPMCNHEAWFQIGKLLRCFGEIHVSKKYLNEACKHYVVLGNQEAAGQCCIQLLVIASIEGQNEEAMEYALKANKLCKQVKNWRKLLYYSCRLLLSLRKYEQVAGFACKIYNTIDQLIKSLSKQNTQKLIFESEVLELKDILTLVQILDIDQRFTESHQEQIANPVKGIIDSVKRVQQRLAGGELWTHENYHYFYKVSDKIINFFIFGKEKRSHINKSVFEKVFNLVIKIEKKLFDLMKYTLIGSGSEFSQNQLIGLYQKYRYLISNAYAYDSLLSINGQAVTLEDEEEKDEVGDLVNYNNDHFKKFMDTLNLEIKRKMMPVPVNLSPVESSISILENIKPSFDKNSYEASQWAAFYCKALTLKARSTAALDSVWSDDINQIESDEVVSCLEHMADFLDSGHEEKLLDFVQNPKCFDLAQQLFESFVENTGLQMSDKSFEFLCKLQHASYTARAIETIRRNLPSSHKLNSFFNLLQTSQVDPAKVKQFVGNDKILGTLLNFPKYEECLGLIPRNAVYVVLQLNLNASEVYCGILTNEKVEQDYQITTRVFKKRIEKAELTSYYLRKEQINKIRKQISYFAYADPAKLQALIEQKEQALKQIHEKFIKMNAWWSQTLSQIINKPKEVPVPAEADKNKKGTKDAKKKGGKDEVVGYESPLGASPAGFESLTFLIDEIFEGFALDLIPGLQSIPAISYDSSLFYVSRKMQAIGFKPEANNSNGLGADKGKYISYEFKAPELGFKQVAVEVMKASPNIKLEGISSNSRIPSIGDFKKYLTESGFLQIHGSLDVLNHLKLPLLLQNCGSSRLRLLLICDHINYEKSVVNKFGSLDSSGLTNSIDNELVLWKLVCNLLDVNLVKNIWTCAKDENRRNILGVYRNLGQGYYLGACANLNRHEDTKNRKLFEKYMNRVHGSPVLRL